MWGLQELVTSQYSIGWRCNLPLPSSSSSSSSSSLRSWSAHVPGRNPAVTRALQRGPTRWLMKVSWSFDSCGIRRSIYGEMGIPSRASSSPCRNTYTAIHTLLNQVLYKLHVDQLLLQDFIFARSALLIHMQDGSSWHYGNQYKSFWNIAKQYIYRNINVPWN